ncbi:MAG: ABC transporter substrate-binding protein, partial [Gloeomargarita sp. SKYG116]|nr:ABC transporter substrate-binding protein [Gloeomargarita sp. SKYG116]MDW8402439.1 ABC transporter substrate-binding protein [Gloeomargarita sp. SKYGB_i_bin116]
DTISSLAAGSEQVIVLTYNYSTGNDMLIARQGIDKVADLKGKKVAAEEGTIYHFFLSLVLEQAGLSMADVIFVPLELGKSAAAFASGQVDAVVVSTPFHTQALKRTGSKVLVSSRDFPGIISDHLVFTRQFVEKYPEQVQAIVNTWFDTLNYINRYPEQTTTIMAKRLNVTPDEYRQYDEGIHIPNIQENIVAFQLKDDLSSLPFVAQRISNFLLKMNFISR